MVILCKPGNLGCWGHPVADCTYEEGLGSPTPKNLPPSSLGSVNGYPCRGDALAIYLNRTDVRDAIGVPHDAFFFSGDNGAGFSYTLTEPNVLPFYLHVITNTSIRVMVVQGSEDPGIIQNLTEDLWLGFLDGPLPSVLLCVESF